mgnify:CR=1 FL=1
MEEKPPEPEFFKEASKSFGELEKWRRKGLLEDLEQLSDEEKDFFSFIVDKEKGMLERIAPPSTVIDNPVGYWLSKLVPSLERHSKSKKEKHQKDFEQFKEEQKKISNEKFDSVKERAPLATGNFASAAENMQMQARAFIVQTFEPRFFDSKRNEGEKGVLINIVLDDGTATMRSVFFGENIKKLLGVTQEELFSLDVLNAKRAELIGEEKLFTGLFRMNSFSNSLEFSVNSVDDILLDVLIKELEAKI